VHDNIRESRSAPEVRAAIDRAKNRASLYAEDPVRAAELVDQAIRKADRLKGKKGPLADLWNYLAAMFRLIREWAAGRYREMPWQSLVLAIASVIYFVSPADLIPDFIPVVSHIDDAGVIALMVAAIRGDLDNFLAWEKTRTKG